MKKIITLLLAAAAFVSVQAQTSKEEARKVILGQPKTGSGTASKQGRDIILGGGNTGSRNPGYPNSGNYPSGSRQAQIAQVNREYNAKIYSIRNNPNLSPAEKERMIRQLESDRARRIREINRQFENGGYNKHGKNGKKDDEHHDNGKHKGWYKGKGNQGKDHDHD
jgi:hypothetical protein